jgi:ribose-phosphate pyrophosphokinase
MPYLLTESARHIGRLKDVRIDYKAGRYPSGEMRVAVPPGLSGQRVYVVGSVLPDCNSLMELLFVANALKASGGKVVFVILYLGYARQDKPIQGEACGAEIVCSMLQGAQVEQAYVVDVHCLKLRRTFAFVDLLPVGVFEQALAGIENRILVAPDEGAVARTLDFAARAGEDTAYVRKQRWGPGRVTIARVEGKVKGKNAIIVDDIIDTGGTVVQAAGALIEKGADNVYVAATHGVFSGDAVERLEASVIKEILVTNTLPVTIRSPKIKVVGIEPLIEAVMSGNPTS